VFLNQNSFVKFILTMKHCDEPSNQFKRLQDEQNQELASHRESDDASDVSKLHGESSRATEERSEKDRGTKEAENPVTNTNTDQNEFEDHSSSDDPRQADLVYQMQVVNANYTRYQNILKILQTGAICKMDNSLFLKKDGRNFLDFALRYLYQEKH